MGGTDIQIAICGSAGDGTIACGDILNQAMADAGYRVIAFDVYPPEIRGFGECMARSRISDRAVHSMKESSDVLVSLNDAHAIAHVPEVHDYGAVIYDDAPVTRLHEGQHISGHIKPGQIPYGLPARQIAEQATGAAKARNMAALGFLAGLYAMPREAFERTIRRKFATKAAAVIDDNLAAFAAGYERGAATFKLDLVAFAPPAAAASGSRPVILSGNAAVVRGLLDARLETLFGYPITPATPILEMLAAALPKHGGRFLQVEDEIAAAAATLGAGFAGARAATATSGPGFALMTEMIGLGVMAEIPGVIIVSQRGGPSTGLPTKTEQADLDIAVHGGAGDAPRIVIAPTNVEGCYRCAGKAFELAETFQVPVIVLLDLYLSNRLETALLPETSPFAQGAGKRFSPADRSGPYRRYALSEDGLSPRAIPGQIGGIHTITGLEHNELGRPSDKPEIHQAMSAKRHRKLAAAVDFPDLRITERLGDDGPVDVGVLAWGSTAGEAREAVERARAEGIRAAVLKVVMLAPLPLAAIEAFLADAREALVCELNYEGQFANLVTAATARRLDRLDAVPGVPMAVGRIVEAIRRLAGREAPRAA